MAGNEMLIDIENITLSFVRKRSLKSQYEICEEQNQIPYYIGQLVHVLLRCKLSEDALKRFNLKRSILQGHPASPNLLANIKRQICSSCDVTCSVNVALDAKQKTEWNDNDVISTCTSLESSNETNSEYNEEHYLSEDKQFYNIFLSVRIPHVSTCCKKAEICVNIKPTNKLAPRWLSSPTKQRPMELEDNIIHPRMKGNTVSKMVTLLHPPRLSASQNSVGNGEFVFLKLQNTTSHPVRLEECLVHPDSCPKGLPGSQLCSSTAKNGGVCESHRNMMSVLASDTAIMPVTLWPGECAAFCYSINVSVCEQSYTKEDIAVVAALKWTIPCFHGNEDTSSLTTVYRVHNVKLRRGLFVVSAACEEKSVKKGKSFTVTYTIHNALQDFLSVKLHWKPAIQGECNEVSRRNFEKLDNHLICEDPCIQLGVCQYGDVVQAKISFCALSTGLYEVCKHLKINLRYLIPGSDNTSLASPASLCSSVSDDHFGLSTEYPLRPRSESGSSFSDTHHYTTEEKRLSNKSFNFGDLQDRSPSETELFVKPRPDKSPVLPRRDPKLGMMSAAKYEQMLLSPGNFIKNSCLVRVE